MKRLSCTLGVGEVVGLVDVHCEAQAALIVAHVVSEKVGVFGQVDGFKSEAAKALTTHDGLCLCMLACACNWSMQRAYLLFCRSCTTRARLGAVLAGIHKAHGCNEAAAGLLPSAVLVELFVYGINARLGHAWFVGARANKDAKEFRRVSAGVATTSAPGSCQRLYC